MPRRTEEMPTTRSGTETETNLKAIFISGYTADFVQNYAAGSDEKVNFLYKPNRHQHPPCEVRRVLDES